MNQMLSLQLKTILIILSVFLCMNCFAQESSIPAASNGLKKNMLYVSTGIFVYIIGVSANVERIIYYNENAPLKYCLIKISYGSWADLMANGNHGTIGVTALTGSKAGHFESHIGLAVVYNKSDYNSGSIYEEDLFKSEHPKSDYIEYYPSIALGYRYQKPGGNLVFRTGIGAPEFLYVSLGISF